MTAQIEDATGRRTDAAGHYLRSAAAYSLAGGSFNAGVSSLALARLDTDLSDFPGALRAGFEAIHALSSAEPSTEESRRTAALASALDAIGNVFHRLEQPVKALDYFRQALDVRAKNVPNLLSESYVLIGAELDKSGAHSEAVGYLQKALDARRQTKNPVQIARALINLAVAQNNLGNSALARAGFTEALALIATTDRLRAIRRPLYTISGTSKSWMATSRRPSATTARHSPCGANRAIPWEPSAA